MSHTSETTTRPFGLRVISQDKPVQTSRHSDHLSVVDAHGAKIAFIGPVTHQPSVKPNSSAIAANSARTVDRVVDWDLHGDFHAQNSTHGEAPIKRPLPTPGCFFSNAELSAGASIFEAILA